MTIINHPIKLIVGVGNPTEEYTHTRHNAGVWFLEQVAEVSDVQLKSEAKFFGKLARFHSNKFDFRLLFPTTYMNESGKSVGAVSKFYDIEPQNIIIAHDDLDLPVGAVRLKFGGGHGGHNGLRDIINHLHTRDFYRLRIGIGHPGNKNRVLGHVLKKPSLEEAQDIGTAINDVLQYLPDILNGNMQKVMKELHTIEPVE